MPDTSARRFANFVAAAGGMFIACAIAETPALALTPEQIFAKDSPSIVVVVAYGTDGQPLDLGSGVVIAKGQVVTNCHVVKDGATLRVKQDKAVYPATLHFADFDRDLCQLNVPNLTAQVVAIGDARTLQVGANVVTIGAPEGLELTISSGLVSALRDFGDGTKIIQTSASISPGSSGGGLFDSEGRLVGITSAQLREGQNLNFALPANWIAKLSSRSVTTPRGKTSSVEWVTTAAALDTKHEWPELKDLTLRWIRAEPEKGVAWFALGRAYSGLHDYSDSITAFRQALKFEPSEAVTWSNLGIVYSETQNYAAATDALREALKLNPNNGETWGVLGITYSSLKQYNDAVAAFERAVQLDPSVAVAWRGLGDACISAQRYSEATSAYLHALKLNPNDAEVWFNLGIAYANNDNRDGAIDAYQHLRKLDPALAEKLFNLAVVSQ